MYAATRSLLSRQFQFYNLWRMKSSYSLTKASFNNGVKTITLSNPKGKNVLSIPMQREILTQLTEDWDKKELRVIVLDAEGPIFSAGHDLREMTFETDNRTYEEIFQLATKIMHAIINGPVPVIAKITGHAYAAGCQLVAQCDIALCTPQCKFATPGVNVGVFCSTPSVPVTRCMNQMAARYMLFTGLALTSHEAQANGLIFRVCENENIDKEVDHICQAIMSKSRSIIMNGKKFYNKQINLPVMEAYERGAQEMVNTLGLKDTQEGINSFFQKRKPNWKHNVDRVTKD